MLGQNVQRRAGFGCFKYAVAEMSQRGSTEYTDLGIVFDQQDRLAIAGQDAGNATAQSAETELRHCQTQHSGDQHRGCPAGRQEGDDLLNGADYRSSPLTLRW